MRQIPEKVIWMLWDAGYDAAPEVVKLCIDSWIARNPTWKVIVLDDRSAAQYVDLEREIGPHVRTLPVQQSSVVLRLTLLARYGGVWADATVFCAKPLDAWLPEYLANGFFALRHTARDRCLANWFLAARKDNPLLQRFQRVTLEYFRDNPFPDQDSPLRRFWLRRFAPRFNASMRGTRSWFSWPVRRVLRVYPYFVNHYLFHKLLEDEPVCRAIWDSGKPLTRTSAVLIREAAKRPDGLVQVRAELESGSTPMYKLDWHADPASDFWSAVLPMLRQRVR